MFRLLRGAYVRRYLRISSIRRGLLGGERFWQIMFVLTLLARQAGKVSKRGPAPLVLSEKLEVGEGYEIVHLPPPPRSRRGRRSRT